MRQGETLAGEVVIVSGPPGSGKSTVSAALAHGVEKGVHLESDVFYRFISAGFIAPHTEPARAQNTMVMDLVAEAAAGYADAGYTVVWDGIVGPWFLDRVVARLAARRITPHYLVVRPSRETALQRVRDRDRTSDVSGAEVMFDQMADLGEFEANVIESDGPVDAVVARSLAAIESDRLRLTGLPWVDDRWRVSVKGVLGWDGQFVVLRNARDEWELPGGRLDATDASPVDALLREMHEELGIEVEVGEILDSWLYKVEDSTVLIITYRCSAVSPAEITISAEHSDVAMLTVDQLEHAAIPAGYLASIREASDA